MMRRIRWTSAVAFAGLVAGAYAIELVATGATVAHAQDTKAKAKAKAKAKKKKGAPGEASEAEAQRDIKKEGGLEPKKEYGLDEQLGQTKDVAPQQEESRPTLTPEQQQVAEAQKLAEGKLDEEIQLATQLLQYETACNEAAPVRFRLADLYWEKSKRAFFRSQDFNVPTAERAKAQAQMKALQTRTVDNYKQIVDQCAGFPDYPKTLFNLGRALMEMDRAKDGAQYFTRIIKEFPESDWVPQAWFMIGEYYFNVENSAPKALRAYKKSAETPKSPVYGYAVYKQGWCYVNTADWDLALDRFTEVVTISQDQSQPLDLGGRLSLRKEGLKDYVRAFSHVGDAKKALATFAKIGGKDNTRDMMERLGNWYVSQGAHRNVIQVYGDLIKAYPRATRVPIFQGRIVDATSRLGDPRATVMQAKQLTDHFGEVRARAKSGELSDEEKQTIAKDLKEAEDIAENTLRRLAMEFHAEAKKLRGSAQERRFEVAHDLYKHYLAVFPEPIQGATVNYVFFMRFYFAEVLFKLEKFLDAARNYDMVVAMNPQPTEEREKKIVLAAAEESVRAYDELVQDLDRTDPPEISGTDVKPIPPIKQDLINSCKRYIQYVGSAGDQIVEIRYKVARIYYTYNHFNEAAPAFNDIVKNHPEHEVACYAANLALDIYVGAKDFKSVRDTARAYNESKKLACGEGDKQRFVRIEEQATFSLIKVELEDKKNYLGAAKAYFQFYQSFPKSEYADDAVYNAAVNYDLANRLDQANEVRRFLVEKLPDSPLVPETLYGIAQSHERIVDFQKAALYLEQFAQKYPSDKRSKDALFNAGTYRATLLDFEGSKKTRERFIQLYPTDPEVHLVAYSICEATEREAQLIEGGTKRKGNAQKAWTDAHDCYYAFIRNTRYANRDVDLLCEAQAKRGMVMREKTNYAKGADEQDQFLLKNWASWRNKAGGVDKVPRCSQAVAKIQFSAVEPEFQRYQKLTIAELNPTDQGKKKFDGSIKQKVFERDRLVEQYKKVVETGVAEWGLAALYRIGELYWDSIDKLINAPIPSKVMGETLTDEQKQLLREQLKQMAAPIEESAIEAYRICATRANELGVYNKWSVRALDRLQQLRPSEFAPLVEKLGEVKFVDALTVAKNGVVVKDGDSFREIATASEGGVVPGTEPASAPVKSDGKPAAGGKDAGRADASN